MSKFIRAKRIKFTIKQKEEKILFQRILRKLGYRDRSIIQNNFSLRTWEILSHLSNNSNISIVGTHIPFYTKKAFLFQFYMKHRGSMNPKKLKKYLKILMEEIKYQEKGRVLELGWRVDSKHPLAILRMRQEKRVRIYLGAIRLGKYGLKHGIPDGNDIHKPRPNDIVASNPWGVTITTAFNLRKLNKRSNINKHIGFGEIKESGYQYGRYDENLNFYPL